MAETIVKRPFGLKPIIDNLKSIRKLKSRELDRVVDVDFETTIDKIIVILSLSWHKTGRDVNKTDVIVVNHDDFHFWLEENELLQIEFGQIDDPVVHPISYTEYLTSYSQTQHLAEFVRDENLTIDYNWDAVCGPGISRTV